MNHAEKNGSVSQVGCCAVDNISIGSTENQLDQKICDASHAQIKIVDEVSTKVCCVQPMSDDSVIMLKPSAEFPEAIDQHRQVEQCSHQVVSASIKLLAITAIRHDHSRLYHAEANGLYLSLVTRR
ncbi:hypothetical protein AWU82_29840 [Pseudomonas glycinae]|uniref:Uncharacterized protein n=1 Tax=Pseudomonas glycinae TaxID=1785145 RepID=A0ABM6QI34_9PSED|nr:hypothetical protein AWU82_29840 [Pseudomonas glycinae]